MSYMRKREMLRRYTGASVHGHNSAWRPSRKSADELLRIDSDMLVARARDLVRNNTHVSGALRKIVANVIHTGIVPQGAKRKRTGELDAKTNTVVESAWKRWAKVNKFWVTEQLVLRHWWTDGEVLIHLWIDDDRVDDNICPLRCRVIEADQLDTNVHGTLANGNIARRGIEFNAKGDPVAYHVLTYHPGDTTFHLKSLGESRRIEARDILHIFLPERASQTRGVSMMAAVIEELRDLGEYWSSERIAARLAAAFGIFVKTSDMSGMAANPLGGMAGGTMSGEAPELSDYIEPGRIQVLPVGTEIQVAKNERPGSTFEPYTKTSLKGASVGFGLRYGNFSHDYTDSSYSSERSASLDERRGWVGQQQFLIQELCDPVFARWLELAVGSGVLNAPTDLPVTWQTPGWPWVDPTKDSKAAELELSMGTTTRRKIAAARGEDWDEIIEQLARENEILKEKGILEVTDGQDESE